MLMRPNKAETAVHGCHCPGDIAVRMRKVLARPWVGVLVCHLLYHFFYSIFFGDNMHGLKKKNAREALWSDFVIFSEVGCFSFTLGHIGMHVRHVNNKRIVVNTCCVWVICLQFLIPLFHLPVPLKPSIPWSPKATLGDK